MKHKQLAILSACIVLVMLSFTTLTLKISAAQGLGSLLSDWKQIEDNPQLDPPETDAAFCSGGEALDLRQFSEQHLAKLSQYQTMCGSFVTDKLMVFTGFPASEDSAADDSKAITATLKTFKQAGVSPLVIAEPYVGDAAMSYKDFLAGHYDRALDAYFAALKSAGVTDEMMGTWVPFPESNTPNWNNKDTEPRDFALCVNRYLAVLKKYFPGAKGSVLLNATTYDPNDEEWADGSYISLTPYLQDIDKKLVGSFGMQGFPWVSDATRPRREIFRAAEFLQPDLAIAAAQELRTQDIWLNTGTFARKYARDPERTVQISPAERKAVLMGILEEARNMQTYQQDQYRIGINLFSEDKSHANEATDWSYFQNQDNKQLLKDFLRDAERFNIAISLFDRMH